MSKLHYLDFAHRIDVDEFEAAIGFDPIEQDNQGNDRGHCILPWGLHKNGDTTGKFAIHRKKKVYGCWVCGGGSLLDLTMHLKDMDDEQATDWLYQFTKPVEEKGEDFIDRIHQIMNPEMKRPPPLPYYNERVLEKWRTSDHPWFQERGIIPLVAEWTKLGYAETAVKYAPKKSGTPIDEPYHGRAIILPHFFKSQLVGWQHRWLDDDRPKWVNKYTNTADFPRKETIWGYDIAKRSVTPPVVVESVPTALFIISLGYPAVATFGAAINDQQILLLRTFQQGIRLAPDQHEEGEKKYWDAARRLRRYVPVGWINPPDQLQDREDLGDLVSDPELVCKSIEEAEYVLTQVPISRKV